MISQPSCSLPAPGFYPLIIHLSTSALPARLSLLLFITHPHPFINNSNRKVTASGLEVSGEVRRTEVLLILKVINHAGQRMLIFVDHLHPLRKEHTHAYMLPSLNYPGNSIFLANHICHCGELAFLQRKTILQY